MYGNILWCGRYIADCRKGICHTCSSVFLPQFVSSSWVQISESSVVCSSELFNESNANLRPLCFKSTIGRRSTMSKVSRMLMSKNVNNDVSKDSPIPCLFLIGRVVIHRHFCEPMKSNESQNQRYRVMSLDSYVKAAQVSNHNH